MPATNTGETAAAIYGRMNDRAWLIVLPLLEAGGELRRNSTTGYYYVDQRGGLTAARIKRLEAAGAIRRVGVDTYALAGVA